MSKRVVEDVRENTLELLAVSDNGDTVVTIQKKRICGASPHALWHSQAE